MRSSRSSPYCLMIEPSCLLSTSVDVMYVSSVNFSGTNYGYKPSFVGVGGIKLPVVSL